MYYLNGSIKNNNNEAEIKVVNSIYLGWKLVSKPGEYKQQGRQIYVGYHALQYVSSVTPALWHKEI